MMPTKPHKGFSALRSVLRPLESTIYKDVF